MPDMARLNSGFEELFIKAFHSSCVIPSAKRFALKEGKDKMVKRAGMIPNVEGEYDEWEDW